MTSVRGLNPSCARRLLRTYACSTLVAFQPDFFEAILAVISEAVAERKGRSSAMDTVAVVPSKDEPSASAPARSALLKDGT